MATEELIRFRPHHFMCTLSFRGKGYSLGFIKNYKKIVQLLKEDEETIIEVVEYMDDICKPCPNRIDEVVCRSQEKILGLDKRHSEVLGLKPGDKISWKEAKELIKSRLSVDDFHYACSGCSWKQYGVCEGALKELKK